MPKCSQLFDKLRRDAPDELLKIIPIAGDVTEHELGISEADQNVIIRDVSIVFHSAATVKFDEPLKRSVHINMIGTKQLLNLCHRMHNLEVNIYIIIYIKTLIYKYTMQIEQYAIMYNILY